MSFLSSASMQATQMNLNHKNGSLLISSDTQMLIFLSSKLKAWRQIFYKQVSLNGLNRRYCLPHSFNFLQFFLVMDLSFTVHLKFSFRKTVHKRCQLFSSHEQNDTVYFGPNWIIAVLFSWNNYKWKHCDFACGCSFASSFQDDHQNVFKWMLLILLLRDDEYLCTSSEPNGAIQSTKV